jgi:hypothetical protein
MGVPCGCPGAARIDRVTLLDVPSRTLQLHVFSVEDCDLLKCMRHVLAQTSWNCPLLVIYPVLVIYDYLVCRDLHDTHHGRVCDSSTTCNCPRCCATKLSHYSGPWGASWLRMLLFLAGLT